MEISETLIKKYNVPVPRYTSYPPANHFNNKFSENDFLQMLKDSNSGQPQNIAFYIHIPFCRKICSYCGCNSCPAGNGEMTGPYMKALKKEILIVSEHIDKTRLVSQIHYGGGTPNSIDISHIQNINKYLFSEFNFIADPEIAIECNPAYLSFDYIDGLISSGFNRFSLGIQDFNNKILKMVNRTPSAIPAEELVKYLKDQRDNISVNLDFIYGLPGQTVDSFNQTINKATGIRPDRLVTFSYAHVPWVKKHQVILERKGLPTPQNKVKMFLSAYSLLKESGYYPIGLDHFVLPDDDLYLALKDHQLHRNFQGYCTRRTTGQVYAFGITAISQLEKGYSQNKKDIVEYIKSVEGGMLPVERGYILNKEQMLTRDVITDLMCNKRINFSYIAERQGVSVQELKDSVNFKKSMFEDLINDGLINIADEELEVTEKGAFFMRNIAVLFDREYSEKIQTYSRTV